MKKRKNNNLSFWREKINKKTNITYLIIILLIILLLSISIIYIYKNSKEGNSETKIYFGNLYSANQAANFIDNYEEQSNIVISPFNLNTTLAILYNGTDNNTNKELKKYFKDTSSNINEHMSNKLEHLKVEKKESNKYIALYESFIKELEKNNYHTLTSSKIKLLSNAEKRNLQELLEKINLIYSRIQNSNNLTVEYINSHKVGENVITNEYTLQLMLEEVLDKYETFSITNEIIDYHEILINNTLNEENIIESFIKNTSIYNNKLTFLDLSNTQDTINYINNKLKSISNENINRITNEKSLNENIMINSLYFNYEWENIINSNNVRSEAFYEENDIISQVDMMYTKESRYLENRNAQGFIKDFQDGKYSFVGVLPKKEDFIISSLDIDSLLLSEKKETVTVGLPKFTIQSEINISKLLSNQNINEIFSNKANFSKITEEEFHLANNIQKIYLEIGEKGTTSTTITKSNLESYIEEEDEKRIILNRPFVFLIINNETNDVLLIGRINKFSN